ncbi:type VI secretion system baseplate subunit TssK [Francisella philomiragia]|uniref:type VI secretion system baseplate subunit TssK n=1 Tax=Francisella philomiragia TaxID=28110 RepID=UPI003516451C
MTTLVNWQSGLILSPQLLKQHDQWMVTELQDLILSLNTSINNYGIIDAQLNNTALNNGILRINFLTFSDPSQKKIINIKPDHQLILNLYEEELDSEGRVYLNQYTINTDVDGINVNLDKYSLTTSPDLLAQKSILLCHLEKNQDKFILTEPFSAMVMLSHDIGQPLLKKIYNYLNVIQQSVVNNIESDLRSLFLDKLLQIKFKISKAISRQILLKTTDLFELLVYLINNFNYLNDEELSKFVYYHENINMTFSMIFEYFDNWIALPKKINQITFYKEDNYLITPYLANDVIKSKKWYLVVKPKNTDLIIDWRPNMIKLCSLSRKKTIDNLALPGVSLQLVKLSDLKYIHPIKESYISIYLLNPGTELDYIISDRYICCLINNDNALNFDYSLYYS